MTLFVGIGSAFPVGAGRLGLVAQNGSGLPGLIGWGYDLATGWVAGVGESALAEMVAYIATLLLAAARWTSNLVWSQAVQASDLDVMAQAGTYALSESIVVVFFVGVLWWSIGAAALKGDVGIVGRRLLIDAPKVVLGSTAMLAVLAAVANAFTQLEGWVVASVGLPDGPFAALDEVSTFEEGSEVSLAASFAVPLVAFFMVLVSLALALFLMVRSAAISLLVVFVPLAMLAQVTPYASMARLIMEKLLALFVSKTVILISLAVGAALMGNIPDDGELYFTSSPAAAAPSEPLEPVDPVEMEEARRSDDAGAARVVGTMLQGLGVMIVAAFSPALVFSLIPSAYHDSSPYSGSDVGGLYGGAGPGGGGFTSARRAAGRALHPIRGRRAR